MPETHRDPAAPHTGNPVIDEALIAAQNAVELSPADRLERLSAAQEALSEALNPTHSQDSSTR
jgi:hypothetical protein